MNETMQEIDVLYGVTVPLINSTADYHSNGSSTTTSAPNRLIYMYMIGGCLICGFGIVCNAMNLIVLYHKSLHESPYIYLTAMSTSDLILLLVSLFELTANDLKGTYFKAFFDIGAFFYFSNACFNFSVWIIVLMTMERAYFVHRPLRAKVSRWHTRVRIIIVFIVCLIINIPRLFCFEIKTGTGNTFYLSTTNFQLSATFYEISWIHSVIINFIPMVILAVTNTAMVLALRKAWKTRQELVSFHTTHAQENHRDHARTRQERDQHRMTRTLIAVVILFFICVIPSAFVDYPIAYALFGAGMKWEEYIKSPANTTLIYICNLLLFLNSSLNFILYCVFNKKFRSAMNDRFQKIHRHKRTNKDCSSTSRTFSSQL